MSTTVVEATPAQPATPVKPATFTNETMVEKFIALRDKVEAIKKRHTEELAPFNVAMGTLEGWMLAELHASGSESVKTAAGTFFQTTRTSVTCPRWSQTLEWIQEHEAWELLEARVNKTAAQAILDEKAAAAEVKRAAGETVDPADLVIPGVDISRSIGLNVRRR